MRRREGGQGRRGACSGVGVLVSRAGLRLFMGLWVWGRRPG